MAAFANLATDLEKFNEMWSRRISNPEALHQTILLDNQVVGGIISYLMNDGRHIGYWIDRQQWGKGVTTEALKQFLKFEKTRPLTATCVADNIGSKRVLEKNRFIYSHSEFHPATGRNNAEVEESIFILK
jgi:RimJ/RimL family protein N-acetyltransferase